MIEFFKKWLGRQPAAKNQPDIKRFSSTTTEATEGSNAKHELDPAIHDLVNRLKHGEQISNSQLNQLAAFYFNVGPIPNAYYKFHTAIQQGMTFEIEGVDTITNEVNDVVAIKLTMREIVYNIDLTMKISIKDFHEFLAPISVQP